MTASPLALWLVLALVLLGCGSGDADSGAAAGGASGEGAEADAEGGDAAAEDPFPEREIRLVLPVGPGGNIDTTARQIQPFWEDELGVTVVVQNIEGGQQAVGAQHVVNAEPDCYTVLFHIMPNLPLASLLQPDSVDYTYDDFYPLISLNFDPGVIRARDDAPWDNLEGMLEDARQRPGEIAVGVAGFNTHFHAMMNLEEATGTDFNLIPYGGAGDQQNALLGGEVQAIYTGVYTSRDLNDMSTVLAVNEEANEWGEFTDDAPTVEEVVGSEVDPSFNRFGFFVRAGCHEDYPERYQVLLDTLQEAAASEGFMSALEELDEQGKIAPIMVADEFDQWIREEHLPGIEEFAQFVLSEGLTEE